MLLSPDSSQTSLANLAPFFDQTTPLLSHVKQASITIGNWFIDEVIDKPGMPKFNRGLGIAFSALALSVTPIFYRWGKEFGETLNRGSAVTNFMAISGAITNFALFAFPCYWIATQILRTYSEADLNLLDKSKKAYYTQKHSALAVMFTIGAIACIPLYFLNMKAYIESLGAGVHLLSTAATLSGAISWIYPLYINTMLAVNTHKHFERKYHKDKDRGQVLKHLDELHRKISNLSNVDIEVFYNKVKSEDNTDHLKTFVTYTNKFPAPKKYLPEEGIAIFAGACGAVIGIVSGYVSLALGIKATLEFLGTTTLQAQWAQNLIAYAVGVTGALVTMGTNAIGNAAVASEIARAPRFIWNKVHEFCKVSCTSEGLKMFGKACATTIILGAIALLAFGSGGPQIQLTFEYVGKGTNSLVLAQNACTVIGTIGVGTWALSLKLGIIYSGCRSLIDNSFKENLERREFLLNACEQLKDKVINCKNPVIESLYATCFAEAQSLNAVSV